MVSIGLGYGAYPERFIALAYGRDANRTETVRARLEQARSQDKDLARILQQSHAKLAPKTLAGMPVIQLGPFAPDERFALVYLSLRSYFPSASILEEIGTQPLSAATKAIPQPKTLSGRISLPSAPAVENEESVDNSIWIALFGLAVIGILYMFLSSDQLRRIRKEHKEIVKRQKDLEVKQHRVLVQMGENIHNLASETARRTQSLVAQSSNDALSHDMKKIIDGENELLGITSDLINFLQIKAHKVAIRNAIFDFNNVLHEVAGTLQAKCRGSDKELVFDLARNVPRQMEADSLHMVQILSNLIEHLMCHNASREVLVTARFLKRSGSIPLLEISLRTDGAMLNEEKLFAPYYDETNSTYVGLGLFVARELLELMNGELSLKSTKEKSTELLLRFPVIEHIADRRQYRLAGSALTRKHVLVVDRNPHVRKAMHQFLDYFRMFVTEMTADHFLKNRPDLTQYDIVAIDNTLFEDQIATYLHKLYLQGGPLIISLENLYASSTIPVDSMVDIRMKKPLTQQHVFDVLSRLGEMEERGRKPVSGSSVRREAEAKIPEVYRGDFDDQPAVTLEDFCRFSGAHILIVEDNPINQKVLQGMLSKTGLKLTIANNGQEALEQLDLAEVDMDLILMDISMPVMDGYEATRIIHNHARWQAIPIVTLSALVSEHEVEKMFASGANGYLSKPLKIGKLFSALERFLPQKEGEEALTGSSCQADTVSQINGLAVAEAISHMQDNTLLYQEVLREFQDFYGRSDVVFEKLIRDMRYEQLRIFCVDLRGLTGSIGAKKLHDIVSETLTMLLYKKYNLLARYISPYREELARLNTAINQYLR